MASYHLSVKTIKRSAGRSATAAAARDQIQVAGSSTVLPYATIVAEAFAENMDFTAPVVEGDRLVGVVTRKGALRSAIYTPAVDADGHICPRANGYKR